MQEINKVLSRFVERSKELNCIYRVEELIHRQELSTDELFSELVKVIPSGWQHSTVCEVKITYDDREYTSDDYRDTDWKQEADLVVDNNVVGTIKVVYIQPIEKESNEQFMPDEYKLLNHIAQQVSNWLLIKRVKKSLDIIEKKEAEASAEEQKELVPATDEHWKWRFRIAQKIADKTDMDKFGVHGIYLIGSSKNATAGPASDIDFLVHFDGDPVKEELLKCWFEGWSHCLAEMNFQKTGYMVKEGLIDLHLVTDGDVENKTSYAVLIDSVNDRARPLKTR